MGAGLPPTRFSVNKSWNSEQRIPGNRGQIEIPQWVQPQKIPTLFPPFSPKFLHPGLKKKEDFDTKNSCS